MRTYLFGGWSQSLAAQPLQDCTTMMYGMVTNLPALTTGTAAKPGWSPALNQAPRGPSSVASVLWTYGGGLCSPKGSPSSQEDVEAIVNATLSKGWDGVDFDDECSMDTDRIIEAMSLLKQAGKETSYTFIGGATYNTPNTPSGEKLNAKVRKVIESGQCDRFVHMCYAASMWNENDIQTHVRQALQRTIGHGAAPKSVVLALTSRGLTDANLAYFVSQVTELGIGGLYVWAYNLLLDRHLDTIKIALGLGPEVCTEIITP